MFSHSPRDSPLKRSSYLREMRRDAESRVVEAHTRRPRQTRVPNRQRDPTDIALTSTLDAVFPEVGNPFDKTDQAHRLYFKSAQRLGNPRSMDKCEAPAIREAREPSVHSQEGDKPKHRKRRIQRKIDDVN